MAKGPSKKKTKLSDDSQKSLAEAAATAWEHYRNYNQSVEEDINGGDGDTDELEELLNVVLKPHLKDIQPLKSLKDLDQKCSVQSLLPVLISVAYFHLADVKIGEYLEWKQQQQEDAKTENEELSGKCQELVEKSLHWYPENASMWSMGANFGRMFRVLSPSDICKWYETTVECAGSVREESLMLVDDKADTSPEAKEWIELLLLNHVAGVEYEVDEEEEEEEEGEEEEGEEKEGEDETDKADDNKKESKKRKAEDEEEEDIEKEEEEGYFSTSSVEGTARFMAAMLHSTAGRQDVAKEHLQHFPITHRIHPNLWQPPADKSSEEKSDKVVRHQSPDGVIPKELYQRLCQVFAPKAAYWQESDYNHRGYYSYFHDKPKEKAEGESWKVDNLMDDVIWNHLYPLLANKKSEIVGAEWWVHTRAIQANLGHNLHFDTDESLLAQEEQITHPIHSSVLYLTGGKTGGATVVFDQTPDAEEVASKAWRCVPEDNSWMVFNGDLLHGVLPCPGVKKDKEEESGAESIKEQWVDPEADKEELPHRLTLMVGFWTRRVPDKMKEQPLYCPCGALPPRPSKEEKKKEEKGDDDEEEEEEEQQHTWVEELHEGYDDDKPKLVKPQATVITTTVPVISPAWETLKPLAEAEKEEDQGSGSSLLGIPRTIDHRFFVKDAPKCFRDSLFEKNDDDDDSEIEIEVIEMGEDDEAEEE